MIRRALRRLAKFTPTAMVLRNPKTRDEIARAVAYIAQTGEGADACLKRGALPMQVHYYSPVPDIDDLAERDVWNRRSETPGVDMRLDAQLALLAELGRDYGSECDWPSDEPGDDPSGFYLNNSSFSFGCAAALHGLIRRSKPKKLVEIGSGYSSRVMNRAVALNAADGNPCDYTIIDPYPGSLVSSGLPSVKRLIEKRVECTPLEPFLELGENDILMIDSGHAVKIGGDVNFLFLEVLPRLAPGVIVHIHDIPMPYEYPKVYSTNPAFRVFWTESYLLQAFLAFNSAFEVLLGMQLLMTDHADAFAAAYPQHDPQKHPAISGSFWIRRKPEPRADAEPR